VDYSLLYALQRLEAFRGFGDEPLRGFCLVFFPGLASLFGVVSCVFCCGFFHGVFRGI